MLNKIHVILLALLLAITNALPAEPKPSENTISSDEVDFGEDLPFEAEYYRTSTDRDDFDRPIPSIDGNSIEDDGTGVDLSDKNDATESECTYGITVTALCANEFCNGTNNNSVHVRNLDIQTRNLVLRPDRRSNISLNDFVRRARKEIIAAIEQNDNYSNGMLNSVIGYIRDIFLKTYGYEDNCGISVTLFSEFGKKEEFTEVPEAEESFEPLDRKTNTDDVEVFSVRPVHPTLASETTESDEITTEIYYQPRTLTRPKANTIVQETINAYRALNHWRYPTQA